MLSVVDEEAAVSIQNAYAEGYKQGVLEYQPDCERLQVLADTYLAELEEERMANAAMSKNMPLWVGGGVLAGLCLSFIFGGIF